jgi:hypothetical protein
MFGIRYLVGTHLSHALFCCWLSALFGYSVSIAAVNEETMENRERGILWPRLIWMPERAFLSNKNS